MDHIQIGMLVIAALGLLAGGLKPFHSFIVKRKGTRLEIEQFSKGPFYVRQIKYSMTEKKGYVGSIATWLRVRVTNATSAPVLLSDFFVGEAGKAGRKPVSLAYRKAEIYHKNAEVADPLDLPHRIDLQDGLDFWMLVDVRIPEVLGAMLFELYCKNIDLRKLSKMVSTLRDDTFREARKGIKFVDIVGAKISEISISDPIVGENHDQHLVEPKFGFIPLGYGADILNACVQKGTTFPQEPVPQKYTFEIHLGDGRTLRHIFRTKRKPMWFIKVKGG